MANPYGVPELTVHQVAELREAEAEFVLVDVREQMELIQANLGPEVVWVPLSRLAAEREDALPGELADKDQQVVVFCHTGVRSAQVTAWLRQLGYRDVHSMAGGIEAWALQVDPQVGRY
ncbi:MAG: rhodanese-like domain-containing protein [Candidatus Promineifilaceae bacterium]|nr:rhodanese-like domain-containing protein [Candidatus Promineifilaceae bacterium]